MALKNGPQMTLISTQIKRMKNKQISPDLSSSSASEGPRHQRAMIYFFGSVGFIGSGFAGYSPSVISTVCRFSPRRTSSRSFVPALVRFR